MTIDQSIKRCILPQAKRRTIQESWFLKAQHGTIRFLEATVEDEATILEFLADTFSRQEPVNVATGITPAETLQRYQNKIRKCIAESKLIVAADCFEVCGIIAGYCIERQSSPPEKPVIKDDYAEEINAFPSDSLAIKQCEVFANESSKFLQYFMPADCQKILRIGTLAVRRDYQGSGIGTKLWLEMMRKAAREGFQYVDSLCAACASIAVAKKLGMQLIFKFPYKDFRMNGQMVFGKVVCDGSTSKDFFIGDLRKILAIHGLEDQPHVPDFYAVSTKINREFIDELYVPKLGRTIRFEVAQIEDADVVSRFLRNEFFKLAPMARTFQIGKEEHDELARSFEIENLAQNLSILALDEGKICGILVNTIDKLDHSTRNNGKLELKEDFTDEINNCPASSLKLKQIRGFLTWLDSVVPNYFPLDCPEAFVCKKLGVHQLYSGCKLGLKLWTESLKLAQRRGYKWAYAECNANGSQRIAQQSGMELALSYPFGLCKYNGSPIVPGGKMFDGCDCINLYRMNLESLKIATDATN